MRDTCRCDMLFYPMCNVKVKHRKLLVDISHLPITITIRYTLKTTHDLGSSGIGIVPLESSSYCTSAPGDSCAIEQAISANLMRYNLSLGELSLRLALQRGQAVVMGVCNLD